MAWFGEGFTSLKGQLTNFAKGVLTEDEENKSGEGSGQPKILEQSTISGHVNGSTTNNDEAQNEAVSNPEWDQALQAADKFLGQDGAVDPLTSWQNGPGPSTSSKDEKSHKLSHLEKDVAAMLPRGLANFFHISTTEENKVEEPQKSESHTEAAGDERLREELHIVQEAYQELLDQNADLSAEVAELARVVQDLESQVAVSQDENANLSTGLEELDLQHQQAIERILVDKDEAQKQYEILKAEYKDLRNSYDEIVKSREKTKSVSPLPSITEEEVDCEHDSAGHSPSNDKKYDNLLKELRERDEELQTVEGENATLRNTVKELSARLEKFTENLPPIPELDGEEVEVMEQKVHALESEVTALRKVRSDMEKEIESYRRSDRLTSIRNPLGEDREHNYALLAVQENIELERAKLVEELVEVSSAKLTTDAQNEKLKKEIQSMNCDLESLKEKNKDLIVRLNGEMKKIELLCQEKEANLSNREELVKKYELTISELSEDLQSSQNDVELLSRHNEELKRDLSKAAKDLESLASECESTVENISRRYESEIAELMEKYKTSCDTLESLIEVNKELKTTFLKKITKLEVFVEENEHLRNQLQTGEGIARKFKTELSEVSNKLVVSEHAVESLTQENKELKALLDEIGVNNSKAVKSDMKTRSDVDGSRLGTLQSSADSLNVENEKLKIHIKKIEKSVEKFRTNVLEEKKILTEEAQNLKATVELLSRENERLKKLGSSSKEDLEGNITDLNDRLQLLSEESTGLRVSCAEKEKELSEHKELLEKLKGENLYLQEMVNTLTKDRSELDVLLRRSEDESINAVRKVESLEEEAEELRVRLNEESLSKRSENETLGRKLSQLKLQLQELDSQLADAQKECGAKDRKMCEILLESTAIEEDYKNYKEEQEKKLISLVEEYEAFKRRVSERQQEEESSNLHKKDEIITKLESQIYQLQEEMRSTQFEEDSLRQRVTTLENDLADVTEEYEICKDIFRQKENEFKNQLQAREDEGNRLKFAESSVREKYCRSEQELSELKQTQTELVGQAEAMAKELQDKVEKLRKAEDAYQELELRFINTTEDIGELRKKLDETSKTLTQTESRLTESQNLCGRLEAEKSELSASLQVKQMECSGMNSEVQKLNATLTAERSELQKLILDKVETNNRYEQLQQMLKEKTNQLEQTECLRDREVGSLKQEAESLRNQLEYASQLLRVVDRQEAEGQPAVDANTQKLCPNGCAQTQEELNKMSDFLLSERNNNTLLRNQVDELAEKLNKADVKLVTLKQHLVEVEENYSGELMVAREKIADLQARLTQADERVRSSSTAYTSASIRANQQVESLTLQVKSLTEQKEKLEGELSKAEDSVQRQVAAVTNLQAVLHQFQRDKQKDIDFETERIRQTLNDLNTKNKELTFEIKQLGEQLNEAKKGLAAATRLSEQLDKKSEVITSLKEQVSELAEKLKLEEEKLRSAYTNVEGKVDRCLVKNLIVGYLSAPAKNRDQAIRVIASVLDLNKEERQKVGLEPASAQQQESLSEAFVRFLETESQPKPQLLLPLGQPQSEIPHSRKTSQASSTGSLLLSEDLPSLPHFSAVGRSPGSILKDVLKDRNS